MKIRPYINFIASVFLLSACVNSVEETAIRATFTVGDEDNEIVLMAGVRDGGTSVTTRAADPGHSNHTPFKSVTKMALRIDGTWLGNDPESIIKFTSATITTNKVKDDKHNEVKFEGTEKCYWDDYGTADPANMSLKNASDEEQHVGNGRDKGLTIYAACVEGESTAPTISSWTSQPWSVGTPTSGVINQTGGWANVDLLTSNNITASADGTYKFDDWMNDLKNSSSTASNLLIFTHAMTKITVELTAGLGFVDSKFVGNPTVKLLGFYYTGNVNVVNKSSSPTSTANIDMHRSDGGAGNTTATYDALVFPGNTFDNGTDILTLTADGNTYFVTAAKLNAAIQKAIDETSSPGYPTGKGTALLQGWNYKLKITVNQSDIVVTATILNWKEVEADTEAPKIRVTASYGYEASVTPTEPQAFKEPFDFFRSTSKTSSYSKDAYVSWDATNGYVMHDQLYWPNHQTHYFFRGVYPRVGTAVNGTTLLANPEAVTTENDNNVIAIANATYTANTYPSDLAIAIPRGTTEGSYDETCKVAGHSSTPGICATEGVINMNFEYAMSKVEVRLKSSATDASHIALTKDNTKVEIIGAYSKARIKLSDGLHDTYADSDKGTYALSNLETPATDFLVTTLDAIVPQEIGDDVIFRITVTTNDKGTADTSDDETDVYECKVNLINVKNSSPATPVTEWIHGKHYIYELDLNKTAIKVTATLKDWVTVTASDNIWF